MISTTSSACSTLIPTHMPGNQNIKILALLMFAAGTAVIRAEEVKVTNPVLEGHFADPSIVIDGGRLYLYATRDPWGGDDLACFSTADFKTWQTHDLGWPTRAACKSDTGNDNSVWAPSVVRAADGRFYLYVSVGSEIFAGVADKPSGPFRNLRDDDGPIIRDRQYLDAIHSIDGEAFVDDDGSAYLYWGSGWDWKNGRCLVARLKSNMHEFATEPKEVTPPGYFEGPFMLKRNGRYYLMYSDGKTIDDSYKVRYAIGDSPLGPFEQEGPNSPILITHADRQVYGPGHHAVFRLGGQDVIAYHRHSRPFPADELLRQICFDRLRFDETGAIMTVTPTDTGIELPVPATESR